MSQNKWEDSRILIRFFWNFFVFFLSLIFSCLLFIISENIKSIPQPFDFLEHVCMRCDKKFKSKYGFPFFFLERHADFSMQHVQIRF